MGRCVADLQQGIYWDNGQRPPRHFAVAFLRASEDANALDVGNVLVTLTQLWRGLAAGRVPDLQGADIPAGNLAWLIGYGRKAFGLSGATKNLPKGLQRQNAFKSVLPSGGGPVLDGAGIMYAPDIAFNPATEDIVVQFTGDTPLSVGRAVVETWTMLERMRNPGTGHVPIGLTASFTGFNREDHRSWIGFHDGISNLKSGSQRKSVIAIKRAGLNAADRWTTGGTYMAFMRLAVNLGLWETFQQDAQERLVGRTKISGCPLKGISETGQPLPIDGCPAPGSSDVTGPLNEAFLEPPDGVRSEALLQSHVQRANHHQGPLGRRASQRFYRQGYEYFEPPVPGRPLQVGLNFVSFQEHPERLLDTLKRDGWLGATNFGGSPGPELIKAYATGIYFCPAVEGVNFPGASIFPLATV